MLPFLLSILWLDDSARDAWIRLHTLGAEQFILAQHLCEDSDPIETLDLLEFAVFARLERNGVETEEDVEELLKPSPDEFSLLASYQTLFGAINLGVTALANAYARNPLSAWREWAYQEFAFPYRIADFGAKAVLDFIHPSNV